MDYITVEGVELLKTGTWNASTGEVTITDQDLQDAVDAWRTSLMPLPVIKLGHIDPRMENPEWDGEPVYGQVDNLSITTDSNGLGVLVGDYINVPAELAEKMSSAYPQRSVELDWNVELLNEEGEVVETFPTVLTAVALLGATPPAVKGLASVHVQFKQRTSSLSIRRESASVLSARLSYPGGHTTESLRQALSEALHRGEDTGEFTWVEDFDDAHVWFTAEEHTDTGFITTTYQQAYTVAEDGTITLTGDPTPVQPRRSYQPISPENLGAARVPQQARARVQAKNVGATRARTAASSRNDQGDDMELTEAQLAVLRQKFDLAEDAPQEDVLAALEAEAAQDTPPAGDNEDPAGEDETPEDDDEDTAEQDRAGAEDRELVAASGETETVTLSRASFAELQRMVNAQGAELAEFRAERAKACREDTLRNALSKGKISRSSLAGWRKALEQDEKITTELLAGLPQMVPVDEIGFDASGNFKEADEVLSKKDLELDQYIFTQKGK